MLNIMTWGAYKLPVLQFVNCNFLSVTLITITNIYDNKNLLNI